MDRKVLKSKAKEMLKGNTSLYLYTGVIYAIVFVLSSLSAKVPELNIIQLAISFFANFILLSIFLDAGKSKEINISNNSDKLTRFLCTYLWQLLYMLVPLVLYVIGIMMIVGPIVTSLYTGVNLTVIILIGLFLTVASGILLFVIQYMLAVSFYLSIDDEFIGSSKDTIDESIKIMNGHKFEFFVLQLSFIPWVLLSVVTCGLGFIYVIPYMIATETQFYLELREKNI